jgi:hypothetical protein
MRLPVVQAQAASGTGVKHGHVPYLPGAVFFSIPFPITVMRMREWPLGRIYEYHYSYHEPQAGQL